MVDPKAHQLYKQLPGSTINFVFGEPGSVWTSTTATNGWEGLGVDFGGAIFAGAAYRTYIDLSGWSIQDLTTFTQGVDIQKSNSPINGSGLTNIIWEFDFITTRRLTTLEISQFTTQPGFLPSTVDLMEVIYAENRTYAENNNIPGIYVTTRTETSGSGNPTAMSRMHWTRLYIFGGAVTDYIEVFPTNLIVQAMTVEEKDLIWIERLRRSYVHQDRADI